MTFRPLRVVMCLLLGIFILPQITLASTRIIQLPGENPRSIDQNGIARFERLDKGTVRRDELGTVCSTGAYANLSVVPNGGMYVAVQPTTTNTLGSLYQMGADDVNPIPQGSWSSSLASDNTQICIHGMQSGPSGSVGPITAPGTGSNQYFLLEAQIQSVDNNSQSLLFINSNNSSSYQNVNTNRVDSIVYQLKAGAVNGSAPSADSGWIGIANILVPGGVSSITSGMITALSAFGGFIGNGTNVTLNGLTLNGASAGCLTTNSSGVVAVASCTSGLGTVNATSPITATTVSGTATISCTTCVTSVNGSGNIASSGGTAPTLSLTGTIPSGNLPATTAFSNTNNNFSVSQTLSAASVTGNTSTSTFNASSWTVGNAAATPPPGTSGNNGEFIVAQATAAPTAQPGNVNIAGTFSSGAATVNGATTLKGNVSVGPTTPQLVLANDGTYTYLEGSGGILFQAPQGTTVASIGTTGAILGQSSYPIYLGFPGATNVDSIENDQAAAAGIAFNVPTGSTNGFQFRVNNTSVARIDNSGNVTATNFFTGSRREWKKNITAFSFDPLSLLGQIDYAEYDCKTPQCGAVGTHKVGIIANDSPVQVSGPKHDHYDAFALAAIDGKAIVELRDQVNGLREMLGVSLIVAFLLMGGLAMRKGA